jgi:phosphoglycerate dehydrogenase-like enzyme
MKGFTKSDFDKPEFRWGIIGTGGIAKAFARDLSYFNSHIVQRGFAWSKGKVIFGLLV